MEQQSSVLRIYRELSVWRDRARAYIAMVDGRAIGKVGNGEVFEAVVEPGRHSVRMKVDWTGSRVVDIEVQRGAVVELVCRSGKSLMAAPDLIRSLWGRDAWIALALKESSSA